jgi:O-acetylhomoserine (thiol)-lyase
MSAPKNIQTQLLHSDRTAGVQHAPSHQPIYKSVQFAYDSAQGIADAFQGKSAGYTYARSNNPTLTALETQLTLLEQGIGTVSFATGMGAIATAMLALLKDGDHIVVSQYLFGNTTSLFDTFGLHGVEISYVDVTNVANVVAEIRDNTRMVFVETLANPRTQIADLQDIGQLCQTRNIVFVVDNTMATPALVCARDYGASLVINSLSKGLSGHGAVLGGSITDTGLFDWSNYPNIFAKYRTGDVSKWGLAQLRKKGLRDMGATLSADAAQMIALGLETFFLRNERACANAFQLAQWLQAHPAVENVDYPGLSKHPQHMRAQELFGKRGFGTLLSFTVKPEHKDVFAVLDTLQVVMISTHLGDNRTMALPVAQTIYAEMAAEQRLAWGITDGLIRVSVGIEQVDDLIADFAQALA